MGKTKTAVLSGANETKLSGKEKYEKKQEKKANAHEEQMVKGVDGKTLVGADSAVSESKAGLSPKAKRGIRIRGKKHSVAKAKINKSKLYDTSEAITLVKSTSYSSFDGTVEFHATIKKDGFSAQVTLPHSAGREMKIEVADAKTVEKLKKGVVDYDILLATAEMMPKLVVFAKILGPKGLMPNPKKGTLIKDAKDAKKFSGNSITLSTERKAPLVHVALGKVSQKDSEIKANLEAVLKALGPKQVVKAYMTSTMGPSVKLAVN